jgi:UDP-N-acetylmuramoylalanine--D-glutamate ligase
MNISGNKISILGAVRSGLGAAKLAKKHGAIPFVSDITVEEKMISARDQLISANIAYEFGQHSSKVFECNLIVTSPGVPNDADIIIEARKKGIKIISELEFASWFCKGKIIAITGTNGKTTTTALCAHTLNIAGFKCFEAGNIGLAFSEIVDEVNENDFVALETSSFQLDNVDQFKPFISMILNLTPDHLDRYNNSVEQYATSKLNISVNQDSSNYFIVNYDDEKIPQSMNANVNRFYFSMITPQNNGGYLCNGSFYYSNNSNNEIICDETKLSLKGDHNKQNALAVLIAAKLVGCSNDSIEKSFNTFKGVEHRLEFVRELNGVEYINDSKATNVDSVWYALQSFDKPIYLILGGKDKGNDYNQIKELVRKNVNKIYAIGSSAQKVKDFFESIVEVEIKNDLGECVNSARAEVKENNILLLSPACASFDMFNSYEHRGEIFKEAVMSLN